MCRALRVLCAAADGERLSELKRATVSSQWELVGGTTSARELAGQIDQWRADVAVIDAALGPGAIAAARAAARRVRVVSVGTLEGADAEADSVDGVRAAVLGLPQHGGPVGRAPTGPSG